MSIGHRPSTYRRKSFLQKMKGKQIALTAKGLTKAQRADAKKADLNGDGLVSGNKEMTALWHAGVDRHDTDNNRRTIQTRDRRGRPGRALRAVDSFSRAATTHRPGVKGSKPVSSKPRRTSHPTTHLTTGLQGQAKTAKIEVQGPGHTRRDVDIVTEQRVTKRRWWSFLGPNFSKKGSEIWNGDVYRLHKDIAAGKHATGVKVKDGKITVTDPTLSGHVNGLLDAYNHLHKHQGKTMTLPNGKKVRVIVNEKTRQAFTWGVLKLLRDGPSSRLAKSFRESDFKPPRLQDIFYNVNFEYNQEVNKTVQRSKRYWPL